MTNQRVFNWAVSYTDPEDDLQIALDTLQAKHKARLLAWQYYEGDHPTRLSSEKLREVFEQAGLQFVLDWIAIIVDAVKDRIEVEAWSVAIETTDPEGNRVTETNPDATEDLERAWSSNDLDGEAEETFLDMVVSGEGYLIGDVLGTGKNPDVLAYANPSYQTHVFYDARVPNKKRFAAKLWEGEDGYYNVQLYYPENLEHYRSYEKVREKGRTNEKTKAGYFKKSQNYFLDTESAGTGANRWGVIPVWHFALNRVNPKPDFARVVSLQDAVNKLLSDMIATAEFNAFSQKWMISGADVGDKEKTLKLPGTPWSVLKVPPAPEGEQSSQLGEWAQGELGQYLNAMDNITLAMSSITRTPKHYFTTIGGDPSGEALQAQEAPLTRKAKRYLTKIKGELESFAKWILEVKGYKVQPENVNVVFGDVRTIQAVSEATVRKTNVESGMPLITQLRDQGWNEEEIDQLMDDKLRELEIAEAADPARAEQRMEAAQERVAAEMRELAQEAMEAVRDGAIDALSKSGAMDRIIQRAEAQRNRQNEGT